MRLNTLNAITEYTVKHVASHRIIEGNNGFRINKPVCYDQIVLMRMQTHKIITFIIFLVSNTSYFITFTVSLSFCFTNNKATNNFKVMDVLVL